MTIIFKKNKKSISLCAVHGNHSQSRRFKVVNITILWNTRRSCCCKGAWECYMKRFKQKLILTDKKKKRIYVINNFCILHPTNHRNNRLLIRFLNELSFLKCFGCKGCFPWSGFFKCLVFTGSLSHCVCLCVLSPRSGHSEFPAVTSGHCWVCQLTSIDRPSRVITSSGPATLTDAGRQHLQRNIGMSSCVSYAPLIKQTNSPLTGKMHL